MSLTTEAFGLSDVGKKREHNEDAMLIEPDLGLYIVADGMGGHAAGEIASARAIAAAKEYVSANQKILRNLAGDPSPSRRAAASALIEAAVQRACSDIYRAANADPSKRGMGTTFACLAVADSRAVIGHVGDSRIYLVRTGQCHR